MAGLKWGDKDLVPNGKGGYKLAGSHPGPAKPNVPPSTGKAEIATQGHGEAAGRASPGRKGPNKTELEALRVLDLKDMEFEGRRFAVLGGSHHYRPDFYGSDTAVEVKAEYISSRDSRILFDAARHAHPELTWIWARKRTTGKKGPRWDVEIYPRSI